MLLSELPRSISDVRQQRKEKDDFGISQVPSPLQSDPGPSVITPPDLIFKTGHGGGGEAPPASLWAVLLTQRFREKGVRVCGQDNYASNRAEGRPFDSPCKRN